MHQHGRLSYSIAPEMYSPQRNCTVCTGVVQDRTGLVKDRTGLVQARNGLVQARNGRVQARNGRVLAQQRASFIFR